MGETVAQVDCQLMAQQVKKKPAERKFGFNTGSERERKNKVRCRCRN